MSEIQYGQLPALEKQLAVAQNTEQREFVGGDTLKVEAEHGKSCSTSADRS